MWGNIDVAAGPRVKGEGRRKRVIERGGGGLKKEGSRSGYRIVVYWCRDIGSGRERCRQIERD